MNKTPIQMTQDIDDAKYAVERAEDKYLVAQGWRHTCQTHGSMWLWEKTFADGRHYLCDRSTAVYAQRSFDVMEANKPHAPVNDGDDFCTVCGVEVADHE